MHPLISLTIGFKRPDSSFGLVDTWANYPEVLKMPKPGPSTIETLHRIAGDGGERAACLVY
jgi:hypothetical protein